MTSFKCIAASIAALGLVACSGAGKGEEGAASTPAAQAEDNASAAPEARMDNAEANAMPANVEIKPGPGPAIWKAADEDTTIYLFGTVHVLPPDLNWRTERFDEVFGEADTVYFEADVKDDDPQIAMLAVKLGTMPAGESLFDLLDAEEKADLISAATDINIPTASLSRLRPWMASIMISLQYIVAEGQDPQSGVEMILLPEAREDGKYVRFFETAEQQLRFMADLPDDVQVEALMEGVRQIKDIPHFIAQMDEAWVNGDVDALGQILLADQSIAAREVYEAMLLNRNLNWADELAKLAREEAGTFFVAVGAGHLAGEDSVALMLEKGGLKVERVQ